MVYLDKCCCCANLRTGALILGWLGLIGGILSCFSISSNENQYDSMLGGKVDHETKAKIINSMYWSALSNNIVGILINALLIYGAYKNNRVFVLPWLIMGGISLIVVSLLILIISILCFVYEIAVVGAIILGIGALYIAFATYIFICVLSFYQFLTEEERRGMQPQAEELGFIPPMQGATAPHESKSAYKPY